MKKKYKDIYDYPKGCKVYYDEVGTGKVKAIFVKRKGTDAILKPLYKKRNVSKSITLISKRN